MQMNFILWSICVAHRLPISIYCLIDGHQRDVPCRSVLIYKPRDIFKGKSLEFLNMYNFGNWELANVIKYFVHIKYF